MNSLSTLNIEKIAAALEADAGEALPGLRQSLAEAKMIGPNPAVHPGEILREEFLLPLKLTPYAVAKACRVPRTRIERLAHEAAPVTADTALRLGRLFNTGPEFWMNLQSRYDLTNAAMVLTNLEAIEPVAAA